MRCWIIGGWKSDTLEEIGIYFLSIISFLLSIIFFSVISIISLFFLIISLFFCIYFLYFFPQCFILIFFVYRRCLRIDYWNFTFNRFRLPLSYTFNLLQSIPNTSVRFICISLHAYHLLRVKKKNYKSNVSSLFWIERMEEKSVRLFTIFWRHLFSFGLHFSWLRRYFLRTLNRVNLVFTII